MQKNRIYSLDVFRLLLAYTIVLHHLELPFSDGAEIAVEVFFILSGFFLGKKFYTRTYGKGEEGESSWTYTLNHARTIYPHFLFALAVFCGYMFLREAYHLVREPSVEGLLDSLGYFYDEIPEALLLNCAYNALSTMLYPTWQLSAILICGYFLYELLRQNERFTRRIVLPASVLMVQSLLFSGVELFGNYGFFLVPLLRGFSSMGMGVLAWYFQGTKQCRRLFSHRKAANILSIFAILMLALFQCRSRVYLITVPLLIILCQDPDCWINRLLNHRCFRGCGKMSLAIFVNHSFIVYISFAQVQAKLSTNPYQTAAICLVVLTLYSLCTIRIVEAITARLSAKKSAPNPS